MLGASCKDAAGPVPLKEVYVLSRIAGQPLPQVTTNETIVVTVISDSLVFLSDTLLDRRRRGRVSFAPGDPGRDHSDATLGTYRRRGDVIFVTWRSGTFSGRRDTLWLRSEEVVGSELLGTLCLVCQPVRIAEFVYR